MHLLQRVSSYPWSYNLAPGVRSLLVTYFATCYACVCCVSLSFLSWAGGGLIVFFVRMHEPALSHSYLVCVLFILSTLTTPCHRRYRTTCPSWKTRFMPFMTLSLQNQRCTTGWYLCKSCVYVTWHPMTGWQIIAFGLTLPWPTGMDGFLSSVLLQWPWLAVWQLARTADSGLHIHMISSEHLRRCTCRVVMNLLHGHL